MGWEPRRDTPSEAFRRDSRERWVFPSVSRSASPSSSLLAAALAALPGAAPDDPDPCPAASPVLTGPSSSQAGETYAVSWTNVLGNLVVLERRVRVHASSARRTRTSRRSPTRSTTQRSALTLPAPPAGATTLYHRVFVSHALRDARRGRLERPRGPRQDDVRRPALGRRALGLAREPARVLDVGRLVEHARHRPGPRGRRGEPEVPDPADERARARRQGMGRGRRRRLVHGPARRLRVRGPRRGRRAAAWARGRRRRGSRSARWSSLRSSSCPSPRPSRGSCRPRASSPRPRSRSATEARSPSRRRRSATTRASRSPRRRSRSRRAPSRRSRSRRST